MPLEATSVAMRIWTLPALNSIMTQSRSGCSLSPWIASAGQPSPRSQLVSSSAVRLVATKMSTRSFSDEMRSRCFVRLHV